MTTTTHRVNAILSTAPGVRKRPCVVCTVYTLCGDVCELCRENLHGLLGQLTAQQDTIIARMTAATLT
jgi:cytochrome oxidase Cu insertion factor (SCO1/SenC/PrrC family)